ncbi:MAG: glycosyl transferase family 1 [Cytophagales bacterium CG18_big_fil_WC_8_21_14_2_50_42_9]|nr:MAG: glycosyl transferase family 1 [Cytophagales bacterium CG18_big_fil_WC_8_21_14_2_50_42_9]
MTADAVGGVWTYALDLIGEMAYCEVEFGLATMGASLTAQQHAQISEYPNVTLFESTYKLEWMDDPWDDLKQAGEWLLKLNKAFKPDIIHLNNFAHGNLNWEKPVLMVVHSCVLSWWQAVKGEAAPDYWHTYRQVVTTGLQAADLVISPSKAMLREAEALYGPFKSSQVIYNGRNPDIFSFKTKEPFIFSMGRVWDEAKNLQALASVAAQLSWPVYIAGNAVHPVTGTVQALENVHYLGTLTPAETREYLSRAAIFALPAKYEPFGLSPLEAALSGCALVLSNLASLQEIWGEAATYIQPDDAEALTQALNILIKDELTRTQLGSRALRQGIQYTAKQMARHYLKAYSLLFPVMQEDEEEQQILVS